MRIELVGRNVEVTEELREHAHKRFGRVAKQVSELARLDLVLREETNPAIHDKHVAEATLHLKGTWLHAEESAPDMMAAVRAVSDDIKRQVKRHAEMQRKRSRTRQLVGKMRGRVA